MKITRGPLRICALCVIILVRNKKTWANLALQEDKSIMKKFIALVMTAICLLAVGCSKQEENQVIDVIVPNTPEAACNMFIKA